MNDYMYSMIKYEREKLKPLDYILFIIIFICPYLDHGVWYKVTSFLPIIKSLGCQFFSFILSLFLLQYSIRHRYRVKPSILYFLVLLATIWTLIKFIQTIPLSGYMETFTIYRRNFILLPTFLFCMSYISNMTTIRINLLLKLILKWLIVTSILFFLQNFGLEIFTDVKYQSIDNVSVIRNIMGLPPIIPVIFTLLFVTYLNTDSSKILPYVFLCITITVITYTRSLMAVMLVSIILSLLFYIIKYGYNKRFTNIIIFSIMIICLILIFVPNIFSFWSNLIDNTVNSQIVNNEGTYAFRQRLIEDAITSNKDNGLLWSGSGYIRDSPKGEYSYVLGTDTYIAPVLKCEGIIGLILRCLPCIYLLIQSITIVLKNKNKTIVIPAMAIAISILSEIPNYVQTTIFVRYNFIVMMLFVLYTYILTYKKQQNN